MTINFFKGGSARFTVTILAFAPGQRDLRHRIGWICHAIRIGAVLWIIWLLAFVVYYWSDKAQILKNYGLTFSIDLGDVSASRYLRWRGIEMTPETSMTTGAIVAR